LTVGVSRCLFYHINYQARRKFFGGAALVISAGLAARRCFFGDGGARYFQLTGGG